MIKRQQLIFTVLMLTVSMVMGDLAGYWAFNEGSGMTTTDSSGNGKTGVLSSANKSNYPQWTAGHDGTGSALRFNTNTFSSVNSNRMVVDPNTMVMDPNLPGLTNLGEAFTIALWVRRDALDYFNNLFPNLVHTSAYSVQLALDPSAASSSPDAYDYLGWTGVSGNRIAIGTETTTQKTLGVWYHLAVTCDGAFIKKYVNGTEIESVSIPGIEMPVATANFVIGSKLDNTSYFTGALDDVAVWAGSYLPAAEVAKLANHTATPLTVVDEEPEPGLPDNYFIKESELAWRQSGWKMLWSRSFEWDITLQANNTTNPIWWAYQTVLAPGERAACGYDCVGSKWTAVDLTSPSYTVAASDVDRYGIEWIDPSWSGTVEPNIAVFAAYITPGIALCQRSWGYQEYNPAYGWTLKDYFKTYARVAVVNGSNTTQLCVRSYSCTGDSPTVDPNTIMTLLGEVYLPLCKGDHVWQELKFAYPKPTVGTPIVWTEISFVGGNDNTVVYLDEFNPVSDQANTDQHIATYRAGDFNKDTIVNNEDILTFASGWLDSSTGMLDPRNSGLLANGDFSWDLNQVSEEGLHKVMNPAGWTFTGTGNYGICHLSQRGRTGYIYGMPHQNPVGVNVSAYTCDMVSAPAKDSYIDDPNGVLEQSTSTVAVAGQTYYAMGYVMASGNESGEWYGWKDTATMEIVVDNVIKATFSRPLSRSIWRALYGTYTADAADAGKPITIRFSYANTFTHYYVQSGTMYVGYAYLGTTIPNEWPEKRSNRLVNGGFEDLSIIQTALPELYTSLTTTDGWGAWFTTGMPTTSLLPNWIYEVPSSYDLNNQGGIFSSAYYSSPIPSPGLNDIVVYGSGSMVYGQIIGTLTPGLTYNLDMACGVLIDPKLWGAYATTWPKPAPVLHIELWRIPAGVTNSAVIHTGVMTSQSGYVKIAEAFADATGDIKGASSTSTPKKSNWQMIGTTYTATTADTNVYVRVYGTNAVAATCPSFVFSDVYLSTEKRQVQGGTLICDIAPGTPYDVLGPYDCYQGGLMGINAPVEDLNGDCVVNMIDLAMIADNWLENWYTSITGKAPWE
ncbi:MAG: LamG domain-containing protein [Anaerohalosphaeraceae bacterium]